MYFAIDPSSGTEIHAVEALSGRFYRCPACGARVALRRGSKRAEHFAHRQWAARPDCENYTPPHLEYRRRPPGEGRPAGPGISISYLALSMSIDGPRLGYWLPPAPDANWSGAIEFEAYETSRKFQVGNLRKGQRVDFPLADGQWEVRATGSVADEYADVLTTGRQSLDPSGSIFDATGAAGRQVLPGQSVTFGQALYWVSRVPLDPQVRGARLCTVEKVCAASGWHVYLIQLPDAMHTGEAFLEISRWLERKMRLARPKVWIESPWPRLTSLSGFSAYAPEDGDLEVRADRPLDIRIADAQTGRVVCERSDVRELTVPRLSTGSYDLIVNDVLHETFAVTSAGADRASSMLVAMDNHPPMELAYAQCALDELISTGRRFVSLMLTWGHPAVSGVLSVNGRQVVDGDSSETGVQMSPGTRIDAGNLGALEWVAEPQTKVHRELDSQVRERATWLLSVASLLPGDAGERVVVPQSLKADVMFRRLAVASWRPELAPQVRALSKALSEW